MIHLIIEETENKVRHEYWQDLRDKMPYYVCYEYKANKGDNNADIN